MKFVKFLRTPILKNISERLLHHFETWQLVDISCCRNDLHLRYGRGSETTFVYKIKKIKIIKFRWNYWFTQEKYTLKIPWTGSISWKHTHSFSVFIVEQFLHLHQTLRSQSFQINMSLSWLNPSWLDTLHSASNWKPLILFSKSVFTVIKKDVKY